MIEEHFEGDVFIQVTLYSHLLMVKIFNAVMWLYVNFICQMPSHGIVKLININWNYMSIRANFSTCCQFHYSLLPLFTPVRYHKRCLRVGGRRRGGRYCML